MNTTQSFIAVDSIRSVSNQEAQMWNENARTFRWHELVERSQLCRTAMPNRRARALVWDALRVHGVLTSHEGLHHRGVSGAGKRCW